MFARGVRNTVGFDWDPKTKRALVHRQRPRHDRRQRAADELNRGAESRQALRLPVLPAGGDSPIPSSARSDRARVHAAGDQSAPTSPRSACASTRAPCSPSIATTSSSPSTARGTGEAESSATASSRRDRRWRANKVVSATRRFAEGWLRGRATGAGRRARWSATCGGARPTCSVYAGMVRRCSCPTIVRASSDQHRVQTESLTSGSELTARSAGRRFCGSSIRSRIHRVRVSE